MNVENTKKVLEAIEKERGARFYMGEWGQDDDGCSIDSASDVDCGTSMCLAGWANYISFEETGKDRSLCDTRNASRFLGMTNQFRSLSGMGDHTDDSPFCASHDNDAALDALRKCVRDRSWSKYLKYVNEGD
jgi:hypothetical protein